MIALIVSILTQFAFAMDVGPTTFPVFLKEGFSTILEFEEAPTQVVLGDQNLFQVEKLNLSIIIKPLVPYATTNMFVYFKQKETRLFILSASEDAEPTYYKKFTSIIPKASINTDSKNSIKYVRGLKIKSKTFDSKKDYLTLDLEISSDSEGKILPNWGLIRLKYKDKSITPSKLWSERREVQRDSSVKARLIFSKPNIPADMSNSLIIVPLKGSSKSFTANLGAKKL